MKPLDEWYQVFDGRREQGARPARAGRLQARPWRARGDVYNLAADMGGMGFIETNKALCMLSVLINTHMLMAARERGASSASSSRRRPASTRPTSRPRRTSRRSREADAYPAMPEDGYGWEKLFSERMCRHFREDFGLATRVARYHNVYGPFGTYDGGREKAPAAICRKVVQAKLSGSTRDRDLGRRRADAQLHVRRRLRATERRTAHRERRHRAAQHRQLRARHDQPARLDRRGDRRASTLERRYKLDAPQGVRGRNSDNTLILERLGWEPSDHAARTGSSRRMPGSTTRCRNAVPGRVRRCRAALGCERAARLRRTAGSLATSLPITASRL